MKWITWENVGVDRMGSAWLIRKHIDPAAEFVFAPYGETQLPVGAEPFDIPGTRYSHRHGRSTFSTLIEEFKLTNPVLARIARIIDEADTVQPVALEPAAPGLDLLCDGLRLASPSDQVALERGALLYDALYAKLAADELE